MSNSFIRYELLQRRTTFKYILHPSVGGVLARHLRDAKALDVGETTFIPAYFDVAEYGLLRIGCGAVMIGDQEIEIHVIERIRWGSGLYTLRRIHLDGNGYPVKSHCEVLDTGLSLYSAVMARKKATDEHGEEYFVDVMPIELLKKDGSVDMRKLKAANAFDPSWGEKKKE